MAVRDFRSQRLYVEGGLSAEKTIEASREQANYLLNVLRMGDGDQLLVFNGIDGEWRAQIEVRGRKKCALIIDEQSQRQPVRSPFIYCFAPLKQARLDYMIQKAVEMGAGILQPVITQYTQMRNINEKRIHANIIEAAEQCGILALPELRNAVTLEQLPGALPEKTPVVFCDENAPHAREVYAIQRKPDDPFALLIGPEGGFSSEERSMIGGWKNTVRLGLGPRILRADTAAVAAMAILQSEIGDWYSASEQG